jgi:hypothetical protein
MRYWLILPLCLIKISPCFLVELTVNVQFQIYQVIETSQDDPDIDSADWKWNCNLEQTAGSFIQVISPAITIPEVYTPVYYFQVDELQAIAACLFSSVPVQDQYEFPQLLKRSSHFPYHPTNGMLLLTPYGIRCSLLTRLACAALSAKPRSTSVQSPVLQVLTLIIVLCVDQQSHGTSAKHTRSLNMLPCFDSTRDTTTQLCRLCMCPLPLCVHFTYERVG